MSGLLVLMLLIALALTSLVWFGYELRGDGKNRARCARCWYDMSAASSLTCPECGWTARSLSRLYRSRRSRWRLVTSMALCVVSSAGIVLPPLLANRPLGLVPTPLLVRAWPLSMQFRTRGSEQLRQELLSRAVSLGEFEVLFRHGLTVWNDGVWDWADDQFQEVVERARVDPAGKVRFDRRGFYGDLTELQNLSHPLFSGMKDADRFVPQLAAAASSGSAPLTAEELLGLMAQTSPVACDAVLDLAMQGEDVRYRRFLVESPILEKRLLAAMQRHIGEREIVTLVQIMADARISSGEFAAPLLAALERSSSASMPWLLGSLVSLDVPEEYRERLRSAMLGAGCRIRDWEVEDVFSAGWELFSRIEEGSVTEWMPTGPPCEQAWQLALMLSVGQEADPALLQSLLESRDVRVPTMLFAAYSQAQEAPPEVMGEALKLVTLRSTERGQAAGRLLRAHLTGDEMSEVIGMGLRHSDPKVRVWACEEVRSSPSMAAAHQTRIQELTEDPELMVRSAALRVWSRKSEQASSPEELFAEVLHELRSQGKDVEHAFAKFLLMKDAAAQLAAAARVDELPSAKSFSELLVCLVQMPENATLLAMIKRLIEVENFGRLADLVIWVERSPWGAERHDVVRQGLASMGAEQAAQLEPLLNFGETSPSSELSQRLQELREALKDRVDQ